MSPDARIVPIKKAPSICKFSSHNQDPSIIIISYHIISYIITRNPLTLNQISPKTDSDYASITLPGARSHRPPPCPSTTSLGDRARMQSNAAIPFQTARAHTSAHIGNDDDDITAHGHTPNSRRPHLIERRSRRTIEYSRAT